MSSPERVLRAVRDVFTGVTTHDEMPKLDMTEKAYVTVAIMMVFPEHYLSNGTIYGAFSKVADGLFNARSRYLHRTTGAEYVFVHGHAVVSAARAAHLYTRSVESRARILTLTPPPDLTALVDELGRTPAVTKIYEQVQSAIDANKKIKRGVQQNQTAETPVKAARFIELVRLVGGEELVQEIRRQLNE